MSQQDRNSGGRDCGWDDDQALLFVDRDLAAADQARFEAHLGGCAACRRDVDSWRSLYRALGALAAPEVSPAFDDPILAARPRPAPAIEPLRPRPIRLRPILAGAFISLTLAVVWVATGWLFGPLVLDQVAEPMGHLGVRTVLDGMSRLLAAVKVSETLIAVARTLEPIARSLMAVGRTFQTEFLLVSLLLASMSLWGAVRLALGRPVVERGVRRAHFAF
jgi:hypothetical protein